MSSNTFSHLFFIVSLLLASLYTTNAQKSCKALVLQAGGDLGSYQAGVLSGLIHNTQTPSDFEYDVLSGVSIGAINSMHIAQYPKGQETQAFDDLVAGWKNAQRKDVYKNWPAGILQGLFFKPSLFNNDPEIDFLSDWVKTTPNKRRITVVTTDFKTGEKVTFSEQDWPTDSEEDRQMAVSAALYSSSVPIFFQYRQYQDRTFIDGAWSGAAMDIEDAVFRCREIVDSDDQITLDVIFTVNISFNEITKTDFTALQMYQRAKDIKDFGTAMRAYSLGKESFPDVNFRYTVIPSQVLPNQNLPLDFKPKNIEYMLNLGTQDAIAVLQDGPGVSAQKAYDFAVKYQDDVFDNSEI